MQSTAEAAGNVDILQVFCPNNDARSKIKGIIEIIQSVQLVSIWLKSLGFLVSDPGVLLWNLAIRWMVVEALRRSQMFSAQHKVCIFHIYDACTCWHDKEGLLSDHSGLNSLTQCILSTEWDNGRPCVLPAGWYCVLTCDVVSYLWCLEPEWLRKKIIQTLWERTPR